MLFGVHLQGMNKCLGCRGGSGKGRALPIPCGIGEDWKKSQHCLGAAILSLENVPGLGASSLG